jgi:Rieske Fe-S protein
MSEQERSASAPKPFRIDGNRRDFLRASLATMVACPAVQACEFIELRDAGGTGGPGGDGRQGLAFNVNDAEYAALANVGGNTCVAFGPISVVVYRAADEEIIAFERFCPHQGLEVAGCGGENDIAVEWDTNARELTCIWHGSVFAEDGAVVSGPSPRGLLVFPVTFDSTSGEGFISTGGPGGSGQSEGSSTEGSA